MGAIIGKRQRIGDAAAGKCEPLLTLQIGDFLSQAAAERVLGPWPEGGVEQEIDIGGRDGAEGDPAFQGVHLYQRLQPEHVSRCGPG